MVVSLVQRKGVGIMTESKPYCTAYYLFLLLTTFLLRGGNHTNLQSKRKQDRDDL